MKQSKDWTDGALSSLICSKCFAPRVKLYRLVGDSCPRGDQQAHLFCSKCLESDGVRMLGFDEGNGQFGQAVPAIPRQGGQGVFLAPTDIESEIAKAWQVLPAHPPAPPKGS